MDFGSTIENVGKAVDAAGVVVIVCGIGIAFVLAVRDVHRADDDPFRILRHRLGRAILLGLEVLVAADIIRTVAVEPTFRSLGVLAGIVVIRTFLSFSLEVEIDHRWPWHTPR